MPIAYQSKSIRSFIGAKDFSESRRFYLDLGFEEVEIAPDMSLFKVDGYLAFYLQAYYVKDWVDNSMIFLEVEDVEKCEEDLWSRDLVNKYELVRISPIKTWEWGREIFMHDPSGVLWHFGQFKSDISVNH